MTPTPKEMIIGGLTGMGSYSAHGMVINMTFRLYPRPYGIGEAMATRAGISRNAMLNQLIEAGIDAVLADLPADVREDIEHDAGDVIAAVLKKKGYDVADSREDQE